MPTVELWRKKGQQFFNLDGTAVNAGGTIEFYDAGPSSNPQTVYSDATGNTALGTSVTLDANGRLQSSIYQDTTDLKTAQKDSSGNIIVTEDNYPGAEETTSAQGFTKPLTPWNEKVADYNITVDEVGEGFLGDTSSADIEFTLPSAATVGNGKPIKWRKPSKENTLRLIPSGSQKIDGADYLLATFGGEAGEIIPDGANWHTSAHFKPDVFEPRCRLTPVSGTAIITGDAIAKTSVHLTPFNGNALMLINGSNFASARFTEMPLELATAHVADGIYDCFGFLVDGVPTFGTGTVWDNVAAGTCERDTSGNPNTTELTLLEGVKVNANQMTMRNGASTWTVAANEAIYYGSIRIDDTAGQVTCHRSYGQDRRWSVWNPFNQKKILLKVGDSTPSWVYNAQDWRASNDDTDNVARVFSDLNTEIFNVDYRVALNVGAGDDPHAGIGWNSTTTPSGFYGSAVTAPGAGGLERTSRYVNPTPGIGLHNVQCIEIAGGAATTTWYGAESEMLLTVAYKG